ncbi:MAG: hypothetical protein ABS948_10060 [Solibacillus sp.]
MKSKLVWHVALLLIGAALYVSAEYLNSIDSFWGGMGIGFIVISAIRLGQIGRYKRDPEYAKQVRIKNNDERNQYIATKARAHTFYYSIILAGIGVMVLYMLNMPDIAQVVSMVLCGQLIIYWLVYFFLNSKY